MRNLPHLLRRGHLPRKGPLPGCARSGRWRAGRRRGACSAGSGTRHPPPFPGARVPTWRGRHGLQAGVGTAVVAAAPVPRALGVGLAARHLAGAGGQRARRRRTAVGAGLPGAGRLLGLRGERGQRRGAGAGPRGGRSPLSPPVAARAACTLASACARVCGRTHTETHTLFLCISLTIPVFARRLRISRSQRQWIHPHTWINLKEYWAGEASSKDNTQCDSIYTFSSNTGTSDVWCEKSAEWSSGGWGPGGASLVSGVLLPDRGAAYTVCRLCGKLDTRFARFLVFVQ